MILKLQERKIQLKSVPRVGGGDPDLGDDIW